MGCCWRGEYGGRKGEGVWGREKSYERMKRRGEGGVMGGGGEGEEGVDFFRSAAGFIAY